MDFEEISADHSQDLISLSATNKAHFNGLTASEAAQNTPVSTVYKRKRDIDNNLKQRRRDKRINNNLAADVEHEITNLESMLANNAFRDPDADGLLPADLPFVTDAEWTSLAIYLNRVDTKMRAMGIPLS